MKRILFAAAALVFSVGTAMADPIVGTTWKTNVDDGKYAHIKMEQCGSKICGRIIKSFEGGKAYVSESQGKNLVSQMTAAGNGKYKGGKIWEPSSDKKYKSSMSMNGQKLRVKGCWGPICKKYDWTLVK